MGKTGKVILGLILLAAAATAAVRFGPSLLYHYHAMMGDDLARRGRPEAALGHILWMLDAEPADTDLRLRAVDLYLEMENYSRAEYLLARGMDEKPRQTELYITLSRVYVRQNKLLDAAALLDSPGNPYVEQELREMRPSAPQLSPPPDTYNEKVSLVLETDAYAACYVSIEGDIPSVDTNQYKTPISLPIGESRVVAIAVGENGLVSAWAEGTYVLEKIVEPVVFSDPIIEKALRAELKKPTGDVMSDELWGVESIDLPENDDYESLRDLAYLPNLKTLNLSGHGQAIELSPLSTLSGLSTLKLHHFRLSPTDVERVARWTDITVLDLVECGVSDLAPVRELTNLKELRVSWNSIADLSPLEGMENLSLLDVTGNMVGDLSPLSTLYSLQTLAAGENFIASLRALRTLKELQKLELPGNDIADLAPLSQLTNLQTLDISDNEVELLAPLAACESLKEVMASGNPLQDGLEVFGEREVSLSVE